MSDFENLNDMLSGITGGSSESSLFESALVPALGEGKNCQLNCTHVCRKGSIGTTLGSVLGSYAKD